MRRAERTILHLDMDAYFAEVERLANPRLRGRPVVVGGLPGARGVVATASYEARRRGVRSGMPLAQARRLCPEAVFLPCDPRKYLFFTSRILKLLREITPCTEMWSIDEAFLDVSHLVPPRPDRFVMPPEGAEGPGTPLYRLARSLQEAIRHRFRLSCSLGGGPNKLVAKMATGLHKPGGITLMDQAAFQSVFWPKPVTELWGVGEKTGAFLARLGIRTVGDLARADPGALSRFLGVVAYALVGAARGEEDSPVVPREEAPDPKSLGHEHTPQRDLADLEEARRLLLYLAGRVAADLRQEGFAARVVVLKVRTARRRTYTRQRTLRVPTQEDRILFKVASQLLERHAPGEPIRTLGLTAGGLLRWPGAGEPAPLFPEDRRYREWLRTLDRIHESFGPGAILPAAILEEPTRPGEKAP
jgi:DNA polymerase-4